VTRERGSSPGGMPPVPKSILSTAYLRIRSQELSVRPCPILTCICSAVRAGRGEPINECRTAPVFGPDGLAVSSRQGDSGASHTGENTGDSGQQTT
jgi:hypothetical protein